MKVMSCIKFQWKFFKKTVLKPAKFEGIGLHTGLPSQITVLPGKRGYWYCF